MAMLTSNWIVFFPLACTLFVAQRMTRASDRSQETWSMVVLRGTILMMLWFSFLGFVLRWNPASLLWLTILPIPILILLFRRRRLERMALLTTLQMASDEEQRQELLDHLQRERNSYFRKKARRLLSRPIGVAWGLALESQGLAKSITEKIALRLQQAYGISSAEWDEDDKRKKLTATVAIEREVDRLVGSLLALVWSIPGLIILYFAMTKAIRESRAILLEFDSQTDMSFMGWLADYFAGTQFDATWALWLLVPAALVVLALGVLILWLFPSLMQLLPFRWFCAGYYNALGLSAFAFIVERESDLGRACQQTAAVLPTKPVRDQFVRANQLMHQGSEFPDALRKSGLVNRVESKTLASAEQPQFIIQQLAHWRIENLLLRFSILTQVTVLVTTFVWGIVVAALGYELFKALTIMVEVADQY